MSQINYKSSKLDDIRLEKKNVRFDNQLSRSTIKKIFYQNNNQSSLEDQSPADLISLKAYAFSSQDQNNKKKMQMLQFGNKVKAYKVQRIIKNFISKLRRNTVNRKPVQFSPFQQNSQNKLIGLYFKQPLISLYLIASIINTVFFCIWSSLTAIFYTQVQQNQFYMQAISLYGILWLLIEIILGFCGINITSKPLLKTIEQISKRYLKKSFFIDFLCLTCLVFDFLGQYDISRFIKLAYFLRLPVFCSRIYKLQIKWIDSFYFEKYWILTKILFKNFFFAHFIALILILMAELHEVNWLTENRLSHSIWYQQYVWAYYWATNIMLTVGFGDLNATNYKQAICLIFIQTISCLTLAYNINCIGTLLGELKEHEFEKAKNMKIIKNLTKKNNLGIQMNEKLNKFVEQSYSVQDQNKFEEERSLVQKLPQNLLFEYKIEANFNLLKNTSFLSNFSFKSITQIARQLQTKIIRPGEVIFHQQQDPSIKILKSGEIGYYANYSSYSNKKLCFNSIKIQQQKEAKIISYEFLKKRNQNYTLKSKGYSIIDQISSQNFKEILKQRKFQFQYFFFLKEKHQLINQPIICDHCKQNHLKINCSKMHFIPLKQLVIQRHLQKIKSAKNRRNKLFCRKKLQKANAFINFNIAKLSAENSSLGQIFSSYDFEQNHTQLDEKTDLGANLLIIERNQEKSIKKHYTIGTGIFYFDFWQCQSDISKNYNSFFPECNPDHLNNSVKLTKKSIMTSKLIHLSANKLIHQGTQNLKKLIL